MTRQIDKNKAQALMKQQVKKQDDLPSETSPGAPVDPGKRKFVVGSLGAAPLLYTLSSRPALAAHCSMSGWHSAHLSRPDQCDGVYAKSPGYWKNKGAGKNNSGERWPSPYCAGAYGDKSCDATKFHDIFPGNDHGNKTMWQVLDKDNSGSIGPGNHAVAAILNSAHFGADAYGMTEMEVVDLYMEYVLGNVSSSDLRTFFDYTWRNH